MTTEPSAAGLPHPVVGGAFASPVPAGAGWPVDPADPSTPVATTPADVVGLAGSAAGLVELDARVSVCRACPRLVAWREQVAVEKRRSFAAEPYWGRPLPGFGDPEPRVLVVGLAPAAHGGNRTGRVFTGDRSADWLYAALHTVGLASQPTSEHAADGLRLVATRVVAAVRCAPPANKPTLAERDTCAPWLVAETALLWPSVRAVVALGKFAWDASLRLVRDSGGSLPRPVPRFGHGAEVPVELPTGSVNLLGSYHPSQQNTFTGTLTQQMLVDVLGRAAATPA